MWVGHSNTLLFAPKAPLLRSCINLGFGSSSAFSDDYIYCWGVHCRLWGPLLNKICLVSNLSFVTQVKGSSRVATPLAAALTGIMSPLPIFAFNLLLIPHRRVFCLISDDHPIRVSNSISRARATSTIYIYLLALLFDTGKDMFANSLNRAFVRVPNALDLQL